MTDELCITIQSNRTRYAMKSCNFLQIKMGHVCNIHGLAENGEVGHLGDRSTTIKIELKVRWGRGNNPKTYIITLSHEYSIRDNGVYKLTLVRDPSTHWQT